MQVDFIVVGQGLCGTLLTRQLVALGKSVVVIDNPMPNTSGKVASGLINPVTGMRVVQSWMVDTLLPFARTVYQEASQELGITIAQDIAIADFHTTADARANYEAKLQESPYIQPQDTTDYSAYINYHYGWHYISPAVLVNTKQLQLGYQARWQRLGIYRQEQFSPSDVVLTPNGVTYKDIQATKIIFCEGATAINNPWFSLLPYALNKGEALIVDIPHLPRNIIFKTAQKIAPWDDNLFWVGTSFEWKFDDDKPTDKFRAHQEWLLRNTLKLPFTVTDHIASVRPSSVDHKPFVGTHPHHPQLAICNGMGPKGCSLAPYFTAQLAQHLVAGTPILPDVDVARYKRVLARAV